MHIYDIGYYHQPEIITKFMSESISKGTKEFRIIDNDSKLKYIQYQEYLAGIKDAALKITDEFCIQNFILNRSEFEQIMIS